MYRKVVILVLRVVEVWDGVLGCVLGPWEGGLGMVNIDPKGSKMSVFEVFLGVLWVYTIGTATKIGYFRVLKAPVPSTHQRLPVQRM